MEFSAPSDLFTLAQVLISMACIINIFTLCFLPLVVRLGSFVLIYIMCIDFHMMEKGPNDILMIARENNYLW